MVKNSALPVYYWLATLLVFFISSLICNAGQPSGLELKDKSEPIYSQILDSSKGAWWYADAAKENYKNGKYNEAIVDFTFAIALNPEVPEFYYYRSNSYAFGMQKDRALADFKKALELNPDYLSILNNQGWEFLLQGELIGALRYFLDYLKILPKDPLYFFGTGINSDYFKLLNNLGWESVRKNELPKAVRYFNSYLKLAPKDPDAFIGMAVIYFKYGDIENALTFLDQAKDYEPSLYQGYAGIAALEKSGCVYTPEDKVLIKKLFDGVSNNKHDLHKLTKVSTWKFLVGFVYIFLGVAALFIFAIRIKRLEGYIFYLSILNFSFGLNFLNENPLIQLTELPSPYFWNYAMPIVAFIIPVAFILFIRYFIGGWGWKKSILLLLIYSVFQGIVKIVAQYSEPAKDIYGTTNTIFGFLAVLVLFFHLFLPEMRKNKEVQVIGAGLGFYLLSVFYDNLTRFHWLPSNFSFDDPAYMVFNLCLIYVAFLRITNTEKEYLAVKQDLETARNIQNAILPEGNPKGVGYEVSSAYLPMALIGGDYYDYQIPNDSHIGLLIADVSGHGISAALIASMLKVAFASQVDNSRNPALVLKQINHSLNGQLNNEFITAGYLGIDLLTKELTYSSAGHPPMVFYRRQSNEMNEIKVSGIPIGVMADAQFTETKMQLITGDRLVLYTDGITDVFNLGGESMGKTRFFDLIKETKNLLADDAIEGILSSINKWSGKKEMESHDDDITLIVFDVL